MEEILTILVVLFVLSFLSIIVAFSPTLVFAEVAVIMKSKRPILHSVALIFGIFLAILLFSCVAFTLIDPTKALDIPALDDSIKGGPLIDIAIGSVLVWFGATKLKNQNQQVKKQSKFSVEKIMTSGKLFLFGLLKMATSISSLFAIFFAIRFIKSIVDSPQSQMVAIFYLVVFSVSPFVFIAVYRLLRPEAFYKLNQKFDEMPFKKWKKFIFAACIILGILLILEGVLNRDQSMFGF